MAEGRRVVQSRLTAEPEGALLLPWEGPRSPGVGA
jgi:hypothetical protein